MRQANVGKKKTAKTHQQSNHLKTMQNLTTINTEAFKGTVLFSIRVHRYGNRAKVTNPAAMADYLAEVGKVDGNGNAARVEGSTSTKRLNATKVLIVDESLDAVNEFLNTTKKRCIALCMPSFIREGMFCAKLAKPDATEEERAKSPVSQIAAIMAEANTKLRDELLPELRIALPDAINRAKLSPVKRNADDTAWELDPLGGLGPLYVATDYPRITNGVPDASIDSLPVDCDVILSKFGFDWNMLSLSIPEGLPPELRAAESEKLSKAFADAASEMRCALRTMFAELLEHAAGALKTEPGEKKRIFRDSLVSNMTEFFDTFDSKNIMDDAELAGIVSKCREVMLGIEADQLRKDDNLRDLTAAKLEEIKASLQPLVAELQTRSFDFSAE